MKTITSFEPFDFQRDAVNKILEIVKYNHGACIFDETGLGKTITAATTAINITDGKINVISPKSNQKNWKNVLQKTKNPFEIFTFAKPPITSCEVLIIDEGHNIRNFKSKGFQKTFETVKKFNPIVLILTATPFQNNTRELRDIISLINFPSNTPAYVMMGNLFQKIIDAEKKLKFIDRYSEDVPSFQDATKIASLSNIQEKHIEGISKALSTFSIRNTRVSISEKYKADVELMGHFPKIQKENIGTFFDPNEILIIGNIIDILNKMKFAMQNSLFYSNHPRYRANQSFTGLMRTFLLKRLDSSVYAFKKSVLKMLGNIEAEQNSGAAHSVEIDGNTLPLSENYDLDLEADKRSFESILVLLKELDDSKKLEVLLSTIGNSKAIVFTEFKDTLELIKLHLEANYLQNFVCYSSETHESVLDSIIESFDANYEQEKLFKLDLNLLVATDVLSEGVNLHAAEMLIHFDQKWNPSKLTQRNGRIDRILKSGVNKSINIYHFQVDSVIEGIIELDKKIQTKQSLGAKYLKENTLTLQQIPDFKENITLFYETNEENRRFFEAYETYMGYVLSEGYGVLGEKTDFCLEQIQFPNVGVQEERYYSPMNRNNYLFYRTHPEFNLLYRDAWGELAKDYSKSVGAVDTWNIGFLKKISRPEVKTCSVWLHKRKYLK